jgi:hypothetical protein
VFKTGENYGVMEIKHLDLLSLTKENQSTYSPNEAYYPPKVAGCDVARSLVA